MIFALLIFFVLLYHFINSKHYHNKQKVYIQLCTVILILISGLRHESVGNDTFASMKNFERAINMSWSDVFSDFWLRYLHPNTDWGKDPAEYILYKCLSLVTHDSRIFLFLIAALVLIPVGYFIYKFSNNLVATMFTYVFFTVLLYQYVPNSAVRQPIAMASYLLSLVFLKDKKYFYFVILLLLGSLFHKSVLIGIFILPFVFFNNIRKSYKLSLLIFLIVLLFYNEIGHILVGDNEIYGSYLQDSYYASVGSRPINVILLFVMFYILGFFYMKSDTEQKEHSFEYYGTCLALIFIPLIWIDPSMLRIIAYFALFVPLFLGRLSANSHQRMIFLSIIIIVLMLKSFSESKYGFMWQDMQLHDRYLRN